MSARRTRVHPAAAMRSSKRYAASTRSQHATRPSRRSPPTARSRCRRPAVPAAARPRRAGACRPGHRRHRAGGAEPQELAAIHCELPLLRCLPRHIRCILRRHNIRKMTRVADSPSSSRSSCARVARAAAEPTRRRRSRRPPGTRRWAREARPPARSSSAASSRRPRTGRTTSTAATGRVRADRARGPRPRLHAADELRRDARQGGRVRGPDSIRLFKASRRTGTSASRSTAATSSMSGSATSPTPSASRRAIELERLEQRQQLGDDGRLSTAVEVTSPIVCSIAGSTSGIARRSGGSGLASSQVCAVMPGRPARAWATSVETELVSTAGPASRRPRERAVDDPAVLHVGREQAERQRCGLRPADDAPNDGRRP